MKEKVGFVIVRHVNSELTNKYWKESIKQIRKFYPNNIIMIIDDNSDKKFLNNNEVDINNCIFIKSEYEKRGELLGYYYFYKYKLFEKAVIIHDSVFIQEYINFENIETVKFLWTFENFNNTWDNEEGEIEHLKLLKNNNELINFHREKTKWNGCFGVMSVIDYNFLKNLENKYEFFNILNGINSREKRMHLERFFGSICHKEEPSLLGNCSVYGDIKKYIKWGLTFYEYMVMKERNDNNKFPIIKVWTGR